MECKATFLILNHLLRPISPSMESYYLGPLSLERIEFIMTGIDIFPTHKALASITIKKLDPQI